MRFLFAAATMLAAASGWAQEAKRQPPPQFTSGYQIPLTRAPLPRAEWLLILDVAVLVAVMALGAWLVLSRRSRKELRILAGFSVLYFGFIRLGCVCAIGSIQNVAYSATHSDYRLPWTVAAFFVLPLLAALFFGRIFCGSACPMGALQDLVLVKPLKIPAWLAGPLGALPYAYLGAGVAFAALGTAFVICEYDPFIALFRLNGHLGMVAFGAGMIVLSMFVGRPYCRFLCPYGVLLRWGAAFSKHQVRVTPDECLNCHLCADACPFGAIVPPSAPTDEDRLAERTLALRRMMAVPLLVAVFAFAGYRLAPILVQWDHRVVRANELYLETQDPEAPKTVVMDAWKQRGLDKGAAYWEAVQIERKYRVAMPLLGGWIGLVLGLRTILLARRRKRTDYEADPGDCVHCARCFSACPVPNRPRYADLKNLLEGRP